jgi:hypothetical protein
LLTEVRRLQSLLGERDKAIQDIKEEKDDLEKTVENLKTALRQQEQSAGLFDVNRDSNLTDLFFQTSSRRKIGTWKLLYRSCEHSSRKLLPRVLASKLTTSVLTSSLLLLVMLPTRTKTSQSGLQSSTKS